MPSDQSPPDPVAPFRTGDQARDATRSDATKSDAGKAHDAGKANDASKAHDAGKAPGHDDDEEHIDLPDAPKPKKRTLLAIVLAVVALFVVLFLVGFLPRIRRQHKLREETATAAEARPRVNAAPPRHINVGQAASLPGSIEPRRETTVFARTSGYVRHRYVDIGDKVTEGQLLADLETPEVQQDLLQAQAAVAEAQSGLAQAKSTLDFARISLDRSKTLVPEGLSSQQDLDLKKSSFDTAVNGVRSSEATIRSRQATVQRLVELLSFNKVIAPFAGTVTSRSMEVGELVTAGNGAGQALFKVADVDTLRLFVSVPQTFAPLVRAGEAAQVSVREYPGRAFPGKITRFAGALDPATRTMQTEIEVPNADHALLPGMYAQAALHLAAVHPPVLIPASALLLGAEGTAVLVVGPDQKVHRKQIVIEGDYGADLGVADGIKDDDRVISNPSERLSEGLVVDVVVPPPPPAQSGVAPPVQTAPPLPAASAAAGTK